MLHITRELLRAAGACQKRYRIFLHATRSAYKDKEPIPILEALDSNGLLDTLWAFRAILPEEKSERDRIARLAACDFAEHVLENFERVFPEDKRVRTCIETARHFALGQANKDELSAAESAAKNAAESAAESAAKSAAKSAAESAAKSAAKSAAENVVWSAAWSAAESAAWSATWSTAGSDTWSAAWSATKNAAGSIVLSAVWSTALSAVWGTAKSAEQEWQLSRLREVLSSRG